MGNNNTSNQKDETMTTSTDMTVANTIAQQMGGTGRLSVMVGAKHFAGSENSLQFHFKGCRKANIVKVELSPLDTYTVTFYKYNKRTLECPVIKETEGVYCDMLKEIFENFTGLYLSL